MLSPYISNDADNPVNLPSVIIMTSNDQLFVCLCVWIMSKATINADTATVRRNVTRSQLTIAFVFSHLQVHHLFYCFRFSRLNSHIARDSGVRWVFIIRVLSYECVVGLIIRSCNQLTRFKLHNSRPPKESIPTASVLRPLEIWPSGDSSIYACNSPLVHTSSQRIPWPDQSFVSLVPSPGQGSSEPLKTRHLWRTLPVYTQISPAWWLLMLRLVGDNAKGRPTIRLRKVDRVNIGSSGSG